MTHPLIASIEKLATPIAELLHLKIVNIVFEINKNPANLRINIENLSGDTNLENCENMSRLLEESLDQENIIPCAYTLEISSPGIGSNLTTERDFISFKGFPIIVETHTVFKKKTRWQGKLQGRDEEAVYVNCKGKILAIPRNIIVKVELENI